MTTNYEELKQAILAILSFYQVEADAVEDIVDLFEINAAFDQAILPLLSFHQVEADAVEDVVAVFEMKAAFGESAAPSKVFMPFKELPKGARFKYPDGNDVWVAIESYGNGLVAQWNGLEDKRRQSLCSFVDDEWNLDSVVEVVG